MKQRLIPWFLVLSLFASARLASAGTILQFTELVFNDPILFSANIAQTQTTISAVNVPVNVIFDPNFCLLVGCGGVTNGTFLFNLNATSTNAATLVNAGQDINQNYNGTLSFTNGAVNLLTVNFSDLLSGSLNGSSPTMAASQPPDLFSGSSNVLDPAKLGIPRGFALSFSDLFSLGGGGLARTANGLTLASATADVTGTFNAEPVVLEAVPEPASLMLLGSGLVFAAGKLRRRRQ